MAMVHDLFFDSEEVPFTHETSFQEISLGKCLELLNEEQLSQLINVVAEDYQLKYDLFRQIQKQSVALEEFGKLHQPRSGSCAFCWQAFRIFRREIICNECPRNVCNRCESKGLCKYCHEMRILSYKKAELGILVPFEKDLFGYCKMITLGDPLAFQLRATLELHLSFLLESEIDSQYIMFIITDVDLHFAKDKLKKALENFEKETSHFRCIDDAVDEIRNLLSSRANYFLFECKAETEVFEYYHLVSHAVIYALQHKKELQAKQMSSIQRPVSSRLAKRATFPPLFPSELEHKDFGVSMGCQRSYQCSLSDNWLLKPKFAPPQGALRSQATRFIHRFTPLDMFNNSICLHGNMGEDKNSIADNGAASYVNFLDVIFERSEIAATAGQLIKIRSRIISDQPDMIDVLWFNTRKQIINSGRIRVQRNHDEAILEIFDCNETEDSGELFCVAISDWNICSDVTRLIICHEDLAGDEPEFIQPLHVSHSQSKFFINGFMVLKCRITGYPTPYANFFFKNRLLKNSKRYQIEYNHDVWSLYVWNISAEDEGTYKVGISNRIGTAFSRITIKTNNANHESKASWS